MVLTPSLETVLSNLIRKVVREPHVALESFG